MKYTTITNNLTTIRREWGRYDWMAYAALAAILTAVAVPKMHRAALELETDYLTSPEPAAGLLAISPKAGSGEIAWRKTKATFYGEPYDSRPSRYRTADGTPYRSDGSFCATRLVPLGTRIEVRYKGQTLHLTVRDTQAKRFGHLIDLPSRTWDRLGAKRSAGVLPVEWRVAK